MGEQEGLDQIKDGKVSKETGPDSDRELKEKPRESLAGKVEERGQNGSLEEALERKNVFCGQGIALGLRRPGFNSSLHHRLPG